MGRTSLVFDGIACDHTASGIEFNAYIEGKLTVDVILTKSNHDDARNDNCYFTLYVDGVRSGTRFKAAKNTTTTLELADFDTGAVRNIRLVKQTEPRNALATLSTVSFTGYFEERPADSEKYIEFMGASILSGYGNLTTASDAATAQLAIYQDSTQALTYLSAQRLGADYSITSASGIGLVRGFRPFNLNDIYEKTSEYRSSTQKYEFTRSADAVIINASGNDASKNVTLEEWETGLQNMIAKIRTIHGDDVAIIAIHFADSLYFPDYTTSLFNKWGGTDAGLYICKLTHNQDGGAKHPSIAGHIVAANELVKFIKDNGIMEVPEYKTYQLADELDSIKTIGRTHTVGNAIACDHCASGIEFNAYMEGTLTVDITVSQGINGREDDCYFTLYIDGKRVDTRFKAAKGATTTLELANFSTGGVHNIRLVKQTEPRNALSTLSNLFFAGNFESKPVDAEYYIEFIGDSNVTAYGNLTSGGTATTAQTSLNQDATQSYAYLASQKLGADQSTVATSGMGLVKGYRNFPAKNLFSRKSYYRDNSDMYTPTRVPDLVVVNLGGNDNGQNVEAADFTTAALSLIQQIRSNYGEDIPIIWIWRVENTYYPTAMQSFIESQGGESQGLYLCKLTNNKDGGNSHPSIEGHKTNANELVQFIKDKNILK